ncbi:SGNH/GDSL hydrolase family protein [Arthrobacter sp. R1-13]
MRIATALYRFAVPMVALGLIMSGCGQPPAPSDTAGAARAASAAEAPSGAKSGADRPGSGHSHPASGTTSPGPTATAEAGPKTGPTAGSASADAGKAPGLAATGRALPNPATLAPGSLYLNPATGQNEVIVADLRRTVLLIGDSQSEPSNSWPRTGLAAVGYKVVFCGRGGTGFVASNGRFGNYIEALNRGEWTLPYGQLPLVVIEGGGNDARQGATDAQIVANAERLIAALKQRYPDAAMVMIGTLAKGAGHGGGRRTEVDALLGRVAAKHSLPFVSAGDWLTRYDLSKYMSDEVHMDAQGHRALAQLLAGRLAQLHIQAPQPGEEPGPEFD